MCVASLSMWCSAIQFSAANSVLGACTPWGRMTPTATRRCSTCTLFPQVVTDLAQAASAPRLPLGVLAIGTGRLGQKAPVQDGSVA